MASSPFAVPAQKFVPQKFAKDFSKLSRCLPRINELPLSISEKVSSSFFCSGLCIRARSINGTLLFFINELSRLQFRGKDSRNPISSVLFHQIGRASCRERV